MTAPTPKLNPQNTQQRVAGWGRHLFQEIAAVGSAYRAKLEQPAELLKKMAATARHSLLAKSAILWSHASMSRARPLFSLTRREAVAITLILLGLVGMVRHFSAKPEPAAAPAHRATASTFIAPVLPRFAGDAEAARPSAALQAMRRRLREFVIPWPNIKSLPVSDALALLQHHWQTLPHETDTIPPANFTLSDSSAQQIAAATAPLLVSLEIPGVSLLTQLQLLAAQADLHLRVTEAGAILENPASRPNAIIQTAVLRLDALTLQRFISRSMGIFNEQASTLDESARRESFLTNPMQIEINVQSWIESEVESATANSDVTTTVSDDGYTIDLNAAPEVIEFEGFINYGSPIETTGVNALGQSEPVILTDSRITQPVFLLAHRQKRSLAQLFTAIGIPEEQSQDGSNKQPDENSHSWNANENILTATGSSRTQRLAAETVAAIHDSATAGASLEFATADWQNNEPPTEPTPDSSKIRPATAPATNQASEAPENKHTHQKLRFSVPMSGPLPVLRSDHDYLGMQYPGSSSSFVRTTVEKTGALFFFSISLWKFLFRTPLRILAAHLWWNMSSQGSP